MTMMGYSSCHIVSGSDDQTLRIWRTIKPQNAQGIPTPSHDPTYRTVCTLSGYHNRCIYSVSWSKVNNHIASASGDNSVRVFAQVCCIYYIHCLLAKLQFWIAVG